MVLAKPDVTILGNGRPGGMAKRPVPRAAAGPNLPDFTPRCSEQGQISHFGDHDLLLLDDTVTGWFPLLHFLGLEPAWPIVRQHRLYTGIREPAAP
jgi:hypothetical protein